MLRLGCILFIPTLACAQGSFEISGTVKEANLAVSGAEVRLYHFPVINEFITRTLLATTYSDSQGAFRFSPTSAENYFVEASKPGYLGAARDSDNAEESVELTRERPSAQVSLILTRLTQISGRVIDEEDRPVGNLRVEVLSIPRTVPNARITDREGAFTVDRLAPGRYLVRISPLFEPRLIAFTPEEAAKIDQDRETSYWPGGFDARSAIPVTLERGSSVNIGTLRVRQAPYYRARIAVSGDCQDGEPAQLLLVKESGEDVAIRAPMPPCPTEVLLGRLAPGRYWAALQGSNGWALSALNVGSENVAAQLFMQPSADIRGRVIAAEGASLPARIQVSLAPAVQGLPGHVQAVDAQGRFVWTNVPWPNHRLRVDVPDARNYVREIRLNGVPVTDSMIALLPGAAAQIEVQLDDQTAAVTGTVTDGANPVARARAGLVRRLGEFDLRLSTVADANGRFRLPNRYAIEPGEYRIFALPPDDPAWDDPAAVERIAARAEKLTLERGESRDVSLRVSDPAR